MSTKEITQVVNFKKTLFIYLLSFFFYFPVVYILVMSYEGFTLSLFEPALTKAAPNQCIIALSVIIASVIVVKWKRGTLEDRLYDYLASGFHIGNIALLLSISLDAVFTGAIQWTFPEFLYLFSGSVVIFIFAYITGFAALSLVPALLSALTLYLFRWVIFN